MIGYTKYNLVNDLGFVKTGVDDYSSTKKYFSTGSIKKNIFIPEGNYDYKSRPSRANREVYEGDVLQARMQDTNKIVLVNKDLHGNLFSTGFFQFRPPKELVVPKYLYYFLSSDSFLKRKDELCEGSTQKAINNKNLSKIDIFLPPLKEQQRIVTKLDATFTEIDKAIESTLDIVDSLRLVLTRLRDKIFSPNKDEKTMWSSYKLNDILKSPPKNGKSPPKELQSDEGIPLLKLSAVTGNVFDAKESIYTKAPLDKMAKYLIKNGDLLITRANTRKLVGHVAIVKNIREPVMYPDLIMKMRVNEDIVSTEFIHQYLMTSNIREYIMLNATGANPTMVKINQPVVKNIPVMVPPVSIQKKLLQLIEKIQTEITILQNIKLQKQQALVSLKRVILSQELQSEAE